MKLESLKERRFFLFALTLLFLLFVISISKEVADGGWLFSRLLLPPIGRLGEIAHSALARLVEVKERYLEGRRVYEENLLLKARVKELEEKLLLFDEIKAENRRLTSLLGLKQKILGKTVTARVIGRGGGVGKTFIIDRGIRDGVRVDMPVIAPRGVVGKVIRASFSEAVVQLITDPNSGVAARISEGRGMGVVLGRGRRLLTFAYFSGREEELKPGRLILTSGLDGIFPKGLPLARVVKVRRRRGKLLPEIFLLPLVDLDRLEEVLIIVEREE